MLYTFDYKCKSVVTNMYISYDSFRLGFIPFLRLVFVRVLRNLKDLMSMKVLRVGNFKFH